MCRYIYILPRIYTHRYIYPKCPSTQLVALVGVSGQGPKTIQSMDVGT